MSRNGDQITNKKNKNKNMRLTQSNAINNSIFSRINFSPIHRSHKYSNEDYNSSLHFARMR